MIEVAFSAGAYGGMQRGDAFGRSFGEIIYEAFLANQEESHDWHSA